MATYNKYTRRVRGKKMKIMKSNFIKKLIIILVIIMILSTLLPRLVLADSIGATILDYTGGILMKPMATFFGALFKTIDLMIGMVLHAGETFTTTTGKSFEVDGFTVSSMNTAEITEGLLKELLVGPDTIFSGKLNMTNANIFRSNMNGTQGKVKEVVANIYYLLRNICGFIMLGGLIFTGIRILLSANIPNKKSQYLYYLQDWIIGMVLLVLSHVLMTGIFYISDAITNALSYSSIGFSNLNFELYKGLSLTGSYKQSTQTVYIILFGYLIWLTVVFTISYFKRFLWICVLVVFAPVFSVMYAFGQQTKQIYSKWIREFCLTVFVQPFHMIVYAVLVAIPYNLVGGLTTASMFDLFYALMAITMIRPAEKYMRQLFGMDKGIANMASYDSGKQTITDTVKAGAQVAATVAGAGGLVETFKNASSVSKLFGGGGTGKEEEPPEKEEGAPIKGNEDKQWISEGWDQDSQGRYQNPYNDEWYTEAELNDGADLPGYMDQDDFDEADIQALSKGITSGINGQANNANSENINASTVTINASSVNMEKATLGSAQGTQLQAGESSGTEEDNTTSKNAQNSSEDDGISLEGASNEVSFLEAFKNQGGLEQIGTLANDLIDGHHSLAAGLYVDGTAPTGEWNANSQWRRKNIENSKKQREENSTRKADNWANNKDNISIMTENYIDDERKKAQKKYGKSKDADYIESVAQEQAKTKAKAALKDMSVYVKYGVTDVDTAYKLYKNANDNNFKPDESIRNMAGFNKFNTNAGNVNNINVSNNFTGSNYTTVEQAIPNAKTYYDAGYTNVKDMAWVEYMAKSLNKTPNYAMAVDEALKKKGKGGKLTYNGKDPDMKKVIAQINSHYGG